MPPPPRSTTSSRTGLSTAQGQLFRAPHLLHNSEIQAKVCRLRKLHFEYLGLTLPPGKEHPWGRFGVCDQPTASCQDGKTDFITVTKEKVESSQKIIITRRQSNFYLGSRGCLTQVILPQARKGGAGRKVEGKEGQECFKPALPPKAANAVNTVLLQLICEGPSSLKTNPPLCTLKGEAQAVPPCHPFPCTLADYLCAVAFPTTLG